MNTEIQQSGGNRPSLGNRDGQTEAAGPPGNQSQELFSASLPAGPIGTRWFRGIDWRITAVAVLSLISIPIWRATSTRANPHVPPPPQLPSVAVAKVSREDLSRELVCEAELRPYQEIDLHAKVAGYLETIKVDIGDRVKAGQLLAVIEVPELADDIRRAEAALQRSREEQARAQAAYDEAHLVYTRLAAVDKAQPNLIAQQELDGAIEKDRAAASGLAAAKANVDVAAAELSKLQTMAKYSRITAPFAGVITRRYADPGALIQAGTSSSTQTLPLVRLSQNSRLRLDIPVSVSHVSWINLGDPVEIRVEALNQTLQGTIARSTRKVETATRTMDVEVDVPNTDLKLIPGMYASAVLRLEHREHTLAVPIEAVERSQHCTVLVLDQNHKLSERQIALGLETPHWLEVLSGLRENELVMVGSRTQFRAGQQVEPKLIAEERTNE